MRYFDTRTLSRTMKSLSSENSDSMYESHGTLEANRLPTRDTDNKVGFDLYGEGEQASLYEGLYV